MNFTHLEVSNATDTMVFQSKVAPPMVPKGGPSSVTTPPLLPDRFR